MKKAFIIAEAGVNHNGSIDIAKKLIDAAKDANADAIKFQTFITENIVCKYTKKAPYQDKNSLKKQSQYEMLKSLELSESQHIQIFEYCYFKKIKFLSTPFDEDSVDLLNKLGLDIYKISSGDITNYPLLLKIAKLKKKIILSTGMSYLDEVTSAVNLILKNGTKKNNLSILHATSAYPCSYNEVNLLSMITLHKKYKLNFGYSDHTNGISIPIAAVSLGAKIIEKHLTLNKNMKGPDHKASLNPIEFKKMVAEIRNIELAIGNDKKIPSKTEKKNIKFARKYIVASRKINKGDIFTNQNITTKRSGGGINPMKWNNIIGKRANQDFEIDQIIKL